MELAALRRLAVSRGYVCPRCSARRTRKPQQFNRTFHSSPMPLQGVLEKLEERGLINQIAGNRNTLSKLLATKRVSIYAGIDPTAPSLHLGHLLPLMVLFWLHNHGHNVVSLIGGATARVGDPSGRLTSRESKDVAEQDNNFRKMWAQTERLWERAEAYGRRHGYDGRGKMQILNNADWLDKLNVLDFLRVLGNGMRVGTMLGRDTVRNKLEKGDGMSFSEFTYPLLQGWDWWHMYNTMGVQVQVGGSDQYGNIIAGMDAVSHIAQSERGGVAKAEKEAGDPMGLTVPLLTTSSGEKFGKSAGNAIWLDASMTSPFDLYGFLLKTADADVERYLKLLTFVPLESIQQLMTEHDSARRHRKAQHLLAQEVVQLVHGHDTGREAREQHNTLRMPTVGSIARSGSARPSQGHGTGDDVFKVAEEHAVSEQHITLPSSKVLNTPFAVVLLNAGLVSSKSEGSRLISGGGVYVAKRSGGDGSEELNFVPVRDLQDAARDVSKLLVGQQLVLRLGKWKVRIVEVVD